MPRTKQFNEEETLQKAVDLFWKKGFHSTSMQDLVDTLGINRASLYDTYGGKTQLFEKALRNYIQSGERRAVAFFNSQTSVKKGLHDFFSKVAKDAIEDKDMRGCLAVNTSTELIPHDTNITDILRNNRANFEELFFRFLKHGQEKGEINKNKDIRAIAQYLVSFFNGIKLSSKLSPTKKELDAIIKTGLNILEG